MSSRCPLLPMAWICGCCSHVMLLSGGTSCQGWRWSTASHHGREPTVSKSTAFRWKEVKYKQYIFLLEVRMKLLPLYPIYPCPYYSTTSHLQHLFNACWVLCYFFVFSILKYTSFLLQIQNQLSGAIFPYVFYPVKLPKSITMDSGLLIHLIYMFNLALCAVYVQCFSL